jgi:hypothetical protein
VIFRHGRVQIPTFSQSVLCTRASCGRFLLKRRLRERSDVPCRSMVSRFDQCRFDLTSPYSGATIRKQTKFLHNVPALDAEFGDCFCACRTPPSANNWTNAWNQVELLLPSVPAGALQGHVATYRARDSRRGRRLCPGCWFCGRRRVEYVSLQV